MLRLSTFPGDVRTVSLTGFTLMSSAPVTALDNVVVAIGKLQAQIDISTGGGGGLFSFCISTQDAKPLMDAQGDPFWLS